MSSTFDYISKEVIIAVFVAGMLSIPGGAFSAYLSTKIQLTRTEERYRAFDRRLDKVENRVDEVSLINERLIRIESKVDDLTRRIRKAEERSEQNSD